MTQREIELTDRLMKLVYKATEVEKELMTTKSLLSDAQGVVVSTRKNLDDVKARLRDAQQKFFTERTRNEKLVEEVNLLKQTIYEMQELQFPCVRVKPAEVSVQVLPPPVTVAAQVTPMKRTPAEVWGTEAQAVVSRPLTVNAARTLSSGKADFSGEILDCDGVHAVIDAHILGNDCEFSLVFKLAKPLANFAVTPEPRKDIIVILDLIRSSSSSIDFSGKLIVNNPFETAPVLCASWLTAEGAIKTVYFSLPLPVTKFMSPGTSSASDVLAIWQRAEGSEHVLVVPKIKGWGIAEVARTMSHGGCLTVVAGMDAVGVVLSGMYLNEEDVIARVELGFDVRVKGQARIAVRCQSAYLAKATARALALVLAQ